MPGLSCMNSDFLCFCITYLFREPRSIVGVAPSRERVGAYRTTHLIPLGMAQAPGLAMPGNGASDGHAVCRPRKVEHHKDVPRVQMYSNLGEKTSSGLSCYFSLQHYSSTFTFYCQYIYSQIANLFFGIVFSRMFTLFFLKPMIILFSYEACLNHRCFLPTL